MPVPQAFIATPAGMRPTVSGRLSPFGPLGVRALFVKIDEFHYRRREPSSVRGPVAHEGGIADQPPLSCEWDAFPTENQRAEESQRDVIVAFGNPQCLLSCCHVNLLTQA